MKEKALSLIKNSADPQEKTNILREYLQASALRSLHESGAFACLSFVGGTALRFLYQLPRFSEDLDFSLENSNGYQMRDWLAKLKRDLEYAGFLPEISLNDKKTVHTAWIKIESLLAEAKIVNRPDQKLAIKLEVDTNPPEGARLETKILNRHFMFAVRHHDLSSLMADKIRALCTRKFQKGRDWYDLLWYLSQIPPVEPNIVFLNNSLRQDSDVNWYDEQKGWRASLYERIPQLDFTLIRSDVEAFLERPQDAALLNAQHFCDLLR